MVSPSVKVPPVGLVTVTKPSMAWAGTTEKNRSVRANKNFSNIVEYCRLVEVSLPVEGSPTRVEGGVDELLVNPVKVLIGGSTLLPVGTPKQILLAVFFPRGIFFLERLGGGHDIFPGLLFANPTQGVGPAGDANQAPIVPSE